MIVYETRKELPNPDDDDEDLLLSRRDYEFSEQTGPKRVSRINVSVQRTLTGLGRRIKYTLLLAGIINVGILSLC